MEKIIGLMGAMREEIALLCERMTDKGEETVAGVTFYTGLLQGRRVALCCAGIGKVNAACAAQLLIARFGAKALVFSGIAGNMTDKIGVGDVVIGGTLVYHDADREMISDTFPYLKEFAADPVLVAAAEQACTDAGVKYIVDCVEMEGAAVAHVAAKYGVPCVVLRAMSDNADEEAYDTLVVKEFDITEYCTTAARICEDLISRL